MFDPFEDVGQFHKKFGIPAAGAPSALSDDLQQFRNKFHDEELEEYVTAARAARNCLTDQGELFPEHAPQFHRHLEKALDALVDLTYVVLGTAHYHGFDFREAWRRVHEANMRKMRAVHANDPLSTRRHAHDIVKPPGWVAPDLSDLVKA